MNTKAKSLNGKAAPASSAQIAAGPEGKAPKRAPDPVRRSERSRTAVLEAASSLLSETGYSSVTIDQISARARVSKATVYRWWPNKASIFMELYNDLASQSIRSVDTGSLHGDLQFVLRGAFRMLRGTIAGVALAGFIAEGQANPDVGRVLREKFARIRRLINLQMLERARSRGEIPDNAPLDLISEMISGTVYYGVLLGTVPQTQKRADMLAALIVAAASTFDKMGKPNARASKVRSARVDFDLPDDPPGADAHLVTLDPQGQE